MSAGLRHLENGGEGMIVAFERFDDFAPVGNDKVKISGGIILG